MIIGTSNFFKTEIYVHSYNPNKNGQSTYGAHKHAWRTQAAWAKKYYFLHLSSSYAKILEETNFHTREFPRSGSNQKTEKKKREKEERKRLKVGNINNNGQLRIANATQAAWAKSL